MAENTNMDYSLERADPSDATIGGELSQVFGEESYVQTDPKDPFYVEKVSPFPALAPREDVKFEYEDFSLGAKDSVLNLNTIIRGVRLPVARNREVVNPNLLTPIFKTFKRRTFFSSLEQNNCPVYDAEEIKKQEQKEAIKKLYP